ncbi:PilW family protein [Aquipseudomonas ullengensis]|uniref:Prepilin-type N-terminal cleavage/methylation domain-containing protein n=1 Tax=Aquipseudomonas ullengensis TaxID=2759166 RepID=A0A7W4LP55_9GAMM|nr:prepilin-type N-terminal cleavage/methylation domain-containing protein [Pseudomonas ullengensis]MBB2496766.1 prepilin-type N-terminal cleavage/methylation domain-containing protein [Pseudomonas ullengensis]
MFRSAVAQAGLSLIEMMVALTISCFLIIGITQCYLDNSGVYLFQQGQASNLDKSRFASLILEQLLARTGYRAEPWVSLANSFPAIGGSDGCPAFAAGETIKANSAGSGVCIRYQTGADAAGNELDCQGGEVSSSADVLLNLGYDSDSEQLSCAIGSTSAVLVDDVAGFAISAIPGSADESQSVRFALLLSNGKSPRGGVASDVLERWNSLSGQDLATDSTQTFQISQGSVTLRNLMQ